MLLDKLKSVLQDPPPSMVFEISEAGIAAARIGARTEMEFHPLKYGTLTVSPIKENVVDTDDFMMAVRALSGTQAARKRKDVALILPDFSARISVLDFDNFPTDPGEQLALLRFRMKKSVPFDVDSAIVSYLAQPRKKDKGKIEVLAAVMAAEIVGHYEAPFRAVGFHPGLVTTSSLAALNLVQPDQVTMLVKLHGRILSVLVLDGSSIKLARCVEMDAGRPEEIESVLHPTVAYIEDELKAKPQRIWLCGFGAQGVDCAERWQAEWGVAVEPLKARFGIPGANNAGLLGYLESVAG